MVVAEVLDDVLADPCHLGRVDPAVEFKLPANEVPQIVFHKVVLQHHEPALALLVLQVNLIQDFPVLEHEILPDVLLKRGCQIHRQVNVLVAFGPGLFYFNDHESVVGAFLAAVKVALVGYLTDVLVLLGFDELFYFLEVFLVPLELGFEQEVRNRV